MDEAPHLTVERADGRGGAQPAGNLIGSHLAREKIGQGLVQNFAQGKGDKHGGVTGVPHEKVVVKIVSHAHGHVGEQGSLQGCLLASGKDRCILAPVGLPHRVQNGSGLLKGSSRVHRGQNAQDLAPRLLKNGLRDVVGP